MPYIRHHYVTFIRDAARDSAEIKRNGSNTSSSLPVLFCVDVSASMKNHKEGETRPIDLLNMAVMDFLNQVRVNPETNGVEVAFVTFAGKVLDNTAKTKDRKTGKEIICFEDANFIRKVEFRCSADMDNVGTRLADAVDESIQTIERYCKELENRSFHHYVPFLVVVTDGNDGDVASRTRKVQERLKARCKSHRNTGMSNLIIPFIIGVGEDMNLETLKGYSEGFRKGMFQIRDRSDRQGFDAVFRLILTSMAESVDLNRDKEHMIDRLGESVDERADAWDKGEKSGIIRYIDDINVIY